jgi:hypothetical protein
MSKAYLGVIWIGEKPFTHMIETEDDSTTIENEEEKVLYKINSHAALFDMDNKRIGHFHMNDKGHWYYQAIGSDEEIQFNTWDLLASERKLVKMLIEKELSHVD